MSENNSPQNSILTISESAIQKMVEIFEQKKLTSPIFRLFIEGFG